MYNVGFGDSFLVTVQRRGRPWRMLVDCGVHTQGAGTHDLDSIVEDIIATVAADSDGPPRIDVVVATHRHRDHIAGFDNERWHDVQVGEVWLPWVEDPEDADAVALRNRQQAAALTLHGHFAADGDQHIAEFVLNSLSNDDAMWVLQNGFAGRPTRRYISARGAMAHSLPGVQGGSVYFLGPPRDPANLAVMDPPRAQRWLRADASAGNGAGPVLGNGADAPGAPGGPGTGAPGGLGAPGGKPGGPGELFPGFGVALADYSLRYPHLAADAKLVASFRDEPVDSLAAASLLDRAVNNTSVVFLLQVGEALLLFPGDAQWGAWRPLLDDPDVRSLLAEVARQVFPGIVSMLSVRPIERWANIPKPELVADLHRAPRRVVSSADDEACEGVTCHPDGLWKELTIQT
jgi:hypothetical protein